MFLKLDFKLYILCYFWLIFYIKLTEGNRSNDSLKNGANLDNTLDIHGKLENVNDKENKFNDTADADADKDLEESQRAKPVNKCKCGKTKKRRIVNGTPTSIENYPWAVQLVFSHNDEQFCGGSIINDKYVLTAAHCLDNLKPNELYIRYAYTGPDTRGRKKIIEKFIVHEHYNEAEIAQFDIALLKVRGKFRYNRKVQPVCLGRLRGITGVDGVVMGWGSIYTFGPSSPVLLEATVTITNNRDCRKVSDYPREDLHSKVLCGVEPTKDACQGDSGGPLVWFNERLASYFLVGIVSWGIGCAQTQYPGIYTNVAEYRHWIWRRTRNATYCSAQ